MVIQLAPHSQWLGLDILARKTLRKKIHLVEKWGACLGLSGPGLGLLSLPCAHSSLNEYLGAESGSGLTLRHHMPPCEQTRLWNEVIGSSLPACTRTLLRSPASDNYSLSTNSFLRQHCLGTCYLPSPGKVQKKKKWWHLGFGVRELSLNLVLHLPARTMMLPLLASVSLFVHVC